MNYWKHIDDFFREKLGRYRETPPPDVWEALDKQLDGLIPAPTAPAGPKPSFRWLGHVAMVSLVAVLTIPLVKKMIAGKAPGANKAPIEAPVAANTAVPAVADANGTEKQERSATEESAAAKASTASPAQKDVPATHESAEQAAGAASNTKAQNAKITGQKNKHQDVKNTNGKTISLHNDKKTNKESNKRKEIVRSDKYNSSIVNSGKNVLPEEKETAGINKQTQPAAKTPTKESTKKGVSKKLEAAPPSTSFSRLEAGVKAGYERGFNNDAATKYTISPYLQYNLSSKFALMVQPTIKYAQLKTGNVGNNQSYYKVNQDGVVKLDSSVQTGAVGGTKTYLNYYTYNQTHDSIVKSYTKGGSYLEFEIPILLKYKLTKNLSAYGGVNFLYHKVGITENTYTKQGIIRSGGFTENTIGLPTVLPAAGIDYADSATPFADYKAPSPSKGMLNVGYMLGLGYEYSNRWLFDALLEQSPASKNVESGYNVNAPISAAYFRLSIGYKFIK